MLDMKKVDFYSFTADVQLQMRCHYNFSYSFVCKLANKYLLSMLCHLEMSRYNVMMSGRLIHAGRNCVYPGILCIRPHVDTGYLNKHTTHTGTKFTHAKCIFYSPQIS